MKSIYAGCPMQITHIFPKGAKRLARIPELPREATVRLRWFEHYHKSKNASLTCRYFGISRKTFYKWKKRYDPWNLATLETRSRASKRRRKLSQKKKRISELKNKIITGFFFQVDTISLLRSGLKRYIFTAIDKTSKLAFSRMYKGATSFNARNFLYRLIYLVNTKIKIIQTDNALNERFNRTLKEELIQLGNFTPEPLLFKQGLTEWLIEYDFNRPHQSLGYLSPIEYLNNYQKVLPMSPSSTGT